ncbi:hypothetical protein KAFR_0G00440 [Kazachstania africana CBS 2517]|uniref:Protein kinase domain-containing protein n=1 Tax=Kazachstania africana (strain ATCC 22294 / BCRC 22015 / CBS 2517 / CECT 1963 / NBRC 1671 / NRRL Y-8276) TaxID=1071382 RepID=H2AXH7_KAZAF|nr:hypothetical protein KAFR_0G00440 [Kazachstania africana CBS 2517]CCF59077.1 hypothetical protein KAFR_0G00440 [Kazachstania africana CBS 2517]
MSASAGSYGNDSSEDRSVSGSNISVYSNSSNVMRPESGYQSPTVADYEEDSDVSNYSITPSVTTPLEFNATSSFTTNRLAAPEQEPWSVALLGDAADDEACHNDNDADTRQLPSLEVDDTFFEVQDQYVPDIDFNAIATEWRMLDFQEQKKDEQKDQNSDGNKKEKVLSPFLIKERNPLLKKSDLSLAQLSTHTSDLSSTTQSNANNSEFRTNLSMGTSRVSSRTSSTQSPILLRSSHAQVDPIPFPSDPSYAGELSPNTVLELDKIPSLNNLNRAFNESNSSQPLRPSLSSFIPKQSNRSLLTAKLASQKALSRTPGTASSGTRTLPTNDLTRDVIDEESKSSLTSNTPIPMSIPRTIPISFPNSRSPSFKSSSLTDITHAARSVGNFNTFNMNRGTDITTDEIKEIIEKLPADFLLLPYSQRKKKILQVIPHERSEDYKLIMFLVKKCILRELRTNISSLNNSYNNSTSPVQMRPRHTRHGSIASQYLSSFSSSHTIKSLSGDSNIVSTRPDEKGSEIFNHTLGKVIGYGAWGLIRECSDNSTGTTRAVKIIRFKNTSQSEDNDDYRTIEKRKSRVMREILNWKKVSHHENILPLINFKFDDIFGGICLTNRIEGGNLFDLVRSWGRIEESSISQIERCKTAGYLTLQVNKGLEFIHSSNVVHGDIKLENCLIEKKDDSKLKVLICDFGMSYDMENPDRDREVNIGSLPYASPELITENKLTFKADIWAFAVMLYVMLVGQFPFRNDSEKMLKDRITHNSFDKDSLSYVSKCGYNNLYKVVTNCFKIDPEERLHLTDIKKLLQKRSVE